MLLKVSFIPILIIVILDGKATSSPQKHIGSGDECEISGGATRNINGDIWEEDGNPNPPSSASSGFSDDDSLHGDGAALTMPQLVDYLRERGRSGLVQEYKEIRARLPDGSFNHARQRNNLSKNRYTDVLCFDHSRVLLSELDGDSYSDYIHANFVDGYKQKNAFISTQGEFTVTIFSCRFNNNNHYSCIRSSCPNDSRFLANDLGTAHVSDRNDNSCRRTRQNQMPSVLGAGSWHGSYLRIFHRSYD